MEEKPFRVLLDFSEVNTGISGLKYVWMHVSPRELKTINDFKQAIKKTFSFSQEDFKLFVHDGLLLETEKIAILRENDTVKIQLEVPCETSMECSVSNNGINILMAPTSCHSLSDNAVSLGKSRKRKSDTFITTSREHENGNISANRSKKKKRQDKTGCISNEITDFFRSEEQSINLSQDILPKKKKKQNKTGCISDESTSSFIPEEQSVELSQDILSMKKKKRDRTGCISDESTSSSIPEEQSIELSQDILSTKKKKRDRTGCMSDESTYSFIPEEQSIELLQGNLSGLDKNSKSSISSHKEKSKPPVKSIKRQHPKTPTSEFIAFAMKLSEAERNNQNVCQSDVNITKSKRGIDSIFASNLYKTADIVSKTNLSPISEKSTYELSSSKTPLNLTESFDNCKSLAGTNSSAFGETADGKDNGKKKRRRKRKRKVISSTEDLGTSADVHTEMEGSFLADAKCNETYDASLDTRKHIIFHSPTPPTISKTVTLVTCPNSISDESSELKIESNNLKIDSGLDYSRDKSLNDNSQLDAKFDKGCESVFSEISDSTKESTPFLKKKLKGKSWGITPLPRISSSSDNFSLENNDISRTDLVKPAYQDCTPLNCLPPVGTRLAYKTLELNEEYCPEITEYKEGILRKVDPTTDELEIELVQEEIKPGRSGKFENLWKDEPLPDDQVIKTVSLNWSALIEPRLIP